MEHSLEFLEFIRPSQSMFDDVEVCEMVESMAIKYDFWDNCEDMGV